MRHSGQNHTRRAGSRTRRGTAVFSHEYPLIICPGSVYSERAFEPVQALTENGGAGAQSPTHAFRCRHRRGRRRSRPGRRQRDGPGRGQGDGQPGGRRSRPRPERGQGQGVQRRDLLQPGVQDGPPGRQGRQAGRSADRGHGHRRPDGRPQGRGHQRTRDQAGHDVHHRPERLDQFGHRVGRRPDVVDAGLPDRPVAGPHLRPCRCLHRQGQPHRRHHPPGHQRDRRPHRGQRVHPARPDPSARHPHRRGLDQGARLRHRPRQGQPAPRRSRPG